MRRHYYCPSCGSLEVAAPKREGEPYKCLICGASWMDNNGSATKCRNLSYRNGYKYCGVCMTFYNVEGVRCPVCHTKLRFKPRPKLTIQKERLRRSDGAKYIDPESYGVIIG